MLSVKNLYYIIVIKSKIQYLIEKYQLKQNRIRKITPIGKKMKMRQKSSLFNAISIFNRMPIDIKDKMKVNYSKKISNIQNIKLWLSKNN